MSDFKVTPQISESSEGHSSVGIRCAARLHFGLLRTSAPFGGVGVMVQNPQTKIVVRPSREFSASPEHEDRVAGIAQRIAKCIGLAELPKCEIAVARQPRTHSGFGSGTQLSLAVAEALAVICNATLCHDELAGIADRGKRSAVGVHGYFQGGLIFEDADDLSDPRSLNQIQTRIELPDSWRVVLIIPATNEPSIYGETEQDQFDQLTEPDSARTFALENLVAERLLPAALHADFDTFSIALGQYNHDSGMLFAGAQGGAYNGPAIKGVIDFLSQLGVHGVGQSSWGPGIFAFAESQTDADELCRDLVERCPILIESIEVSSVCNRPRELVVG